MNRRIRRSLLIVACLQAGVAAQDAIFVYGSNRTPTGTAGGIATYLAPAFETASPVKCQPTDGHSGQWAVKVEQPGLYTAAVEEAYGFGPVVRPAISVRPEQFNRVSLTLPFEYDLLEGTEPSEEAHREFGQSFVAAGTAITAIAFADADGVLISMHGTNAKGKQIGPTMTASSFYPPGTLPTVPGQRYYLRFCRQDGAAFRMRVVKDRYFDGSAFLDNENRRSLDLALRIQHCPAGQILRSRPGMTEAFRPAEKSYGQTFVAKGRGPAMLSVFPAGDPQTYSSLSLRLYESGPGGRAITPAVAGRMLVLGPGQVRLTPGQRYYLEVAAAGQAEDLQLWVSKADDFPEGELYLDDSPVAGRDLAMVFVEYEDDEVPPKAPTAVSWRRGMPAYARRFVADGKVRIVWDMPPDNDATKVVVRRIEIAKRRGGAEGKTIREIPVSSAGRCQIVDSDLESGVSYDYTIRAVDAAGNESDPLKAPATPMKALPMSPELLNGDFTEPEDSQLPYGWKIRTMHGTIPALRTGFSHHRGDSIPAAGWEVPEGAGSSDTVLYQCVPCERGRRYRVEVEAYQWNPWDNPSMVICAAVGLDPGGRNNPLAESVVWSSPTFRRQEWIRLSASATARSEQITVFLRGFSEFSRSMNVRFRNVGLKDVTHEASGANSILQPITPPTAGPVP